MKMRTSLLAFLMISVITANAQRFEVQEKTNYRQTSNKIFLSFEDLSSSRFGSLKKKYQLDTIFHGELDEFKRILLLRNWIRKTITINDPGPHPGDKSCESILDHALQGSGFHCEHFMIVQNAIMNAYGYVTRCLGAGPGGVDGVQDHHGINEIWSNTQRKWFLSDAKYNSHFEKEGIPLSALEIRDEFLKNRAADIVRVKGVERIATDYDEEYKITKEEFARTYTNIEWDMYNDRYVRNASIPGDRAILIMYNDSYFKMNQWLWDGKPHWAYHTQFMHLIEDRNLIEWTPNIVHAEVTAKGRIASVILTSATPNFKTYQVRELPGGEWKNSSSEISLRIRDTPVEYAFRALNLADVAGPECIIGIKEKKSIQDGR